MRAFKNALQSLQYSLKSLQMKFNVQVFSNHYQDGYTFSIFYFQEDKFSIFSDEANLRFQNMNIILLPSMLLYVHLSS